MTVPLPATGDTDWTDWGTQVQDTVETVQGLAQVASTGQFQHLTGVPNFAEVVIQVGDVNASRPATTRPVFWFVPVDNQPATNGTTSGGTYATVPNLDFMWTY